MIQLEKICKQYTNHNHTVCAVDNVSFSVAPNERVGIAGGSGSGKSTLLRLIALLEKPTSGNLRLFGKDVTSIQNHTEIYRSMQMMFQNPLAVIPPRMNLEAFLLEPYINYGLMDVAAAKDSTWDTVAQVRADLTRWRMSKCMEGLSIGLGLALCSIALNGLTDHLLFNIPSSMLLFMLAAMTAALYACGETWKG